MCGFYAVPSCIPVLTRTLKHCEFPCVNLQRCAALVALAAPHFNVHFLNSYALQFRDAVFAFLLSLKESQLRDANSEALAVRVIVRHRDLSQSGLLAQVQFGNGAMWRLLGCPRFCSAVVC